MTARVILTGSVLSPLIFSPATVAKMTEDPTVLNDWTDSVGVGRGCLWHRENTLVCGQVAFLKAPTGIENVFRGKMIDGV